MKIAANLSLYSGLVLLAFYLWLISFSEIETIMAVFPDRGDHLAFIWIMVMLIAGGLVIKSSIRQEGMKNFKLYKKDDEHCNFI